MFKEIKQMKMINTVGAIIVYNNKILITKRDQGKYDYVSYKWEFAGGKRETGESDAETVSRELMEELDMKVKVGKYFMTVDHDYPDFHLNMPIYFCIANSDKFNLNVHVDAKWLSLDEIDTLDYADGDMPVVEKLKQLSTEKFLDYIEESKSAPIVK